MENGDHSKKEEDEEMSVRGSSELEAEYLLSNEIGNNTPALKYKLMRASTTIHTQTRPYSYPYPYPLHCTTHLHTF